MDNERTTQNTPTEARTVPQQTETNKTPVNNASAPQSAENDAFLQSCTAVYERIQKTAAEVMAVLSVNENKPDNTLFYIDNLLQEEIKAFKSDKKTGFKNLDILTGGLYSGLYCIAATSSLGKTTFSLQLADQIAAAGHDVIYFSLEQSKLELVSKSLARHMYLQDKNATLTSLDIRRGKGTAAQVANFNNALLNYKGAVSSRMSIVECGFNCDIEFIEKYIEQYITRNNRAPAIFIDYLQILQPLKDAKRIDTKSTVDAVITELAQLKRKYNLTIFVISSVNRTNYLTPIDFESLKESGNIEYTCDVVWGLQFQCINEPLFTAKEKIQEKRAEINKARAATPRKIQLSCLKNRYGAGTFTCNFDYYPANDLFIDNGSADPVCRSSEKRYMM